MRISLCSYWFLPSFGGVETVSKILAEEFTRAGATVTVVTTTAGPAMDLPYRIVRNPSPRQLRALAQQVDIVLQNLISLRMLLPVLGTGKPIVITHASWVRRPDGSKGPETYLKLLALRAFHNVSISQAIADSLPVTSTILENPFDDREFEPLRESRRERDLVFMGRLVSDKGCDVLLHALNVLKSKMLRPTVTIIGDGPDRSMLEALSRQLDLTDQVRFSGALREGRGVVVAQHQVMVIPSLWEEPFGVVALEGIASGCALVASSGGGLKEAVGPCGLLFPNGDSYALAAALERILMEQGLLNTLVAAGPDHLRRFQPAAVAKRYLDFFATVLN